MIKPVTRNRRSKCVSKPKDLRRKVQFNHWIRSFCQKIQGVLVKFFKRDHNHTAGHVLMLSLQSSVLCFGGPGGVDIGPFRDRICGDSVVQKTFAHPQAVHTYIMIRVKLAKNWRLCCLLVLVCTYILDFPLFFFSAPPSPQPAPSFKLTITCTTSKIRLQTYGHRKKQKRPANLNLTKQINGLEKHRHGERHCSRPNDQRNGEEQRSNSNSAR